MTKSRNYSPLKVNIVIEVVNDTFDGNEKEHLYDLGSITPYSISMNCIER